MPKFARIENNQVCEVAEFDSIEGRFHPSLVWVACPNEVQEGWLYVGGSFEQPVSVTTATVPLAVSRFQARAALHLAGLLADVDTLMADPATDPIAVLAWQDAVEFRRDSPTVATMAAALGLSDTDLNALFAQAAQIVA